MQAYRLYRLISTDIVYLNFSKSLHFVAITSNMEYLKVRKRTTITQTQPGMLFTVTVVGTAFQSYTGGRGSNPGRDRLYSLKQAQSVPPLKGSSEMTFEKRCPVSQLILKQTNKQTNKQIAFCTCIRNYREKIYLLLLNNTVTNLILMTYWIA